MECADEFKTSGFVLYKADGFVKWGMSRHT